MATSDSPLTGIYRDQHVGRETTMHIEVSSVLDVSGQINVVGGVLDLSQAATFTMPGALRQGYVPLGVHLFNARNAASAEKIASGSTAPTAFFGGLLMPDGAPSLDFFSTGERIPRAQWVSGNAASIVLPPLSMPQDMATAAGIRLGLFGETVGTASAADAVQAIQILARFAALTSASDADVGSTHPNFSSTPSWQEVTITSGNLTTNTLSIILTPQAHANRAINLYDARMIYTKKTTTTT